MACRAFRRPSLLWMFFGKRHSWLDGLYERSYSMKMGEVHLPRVDLYMVNEHSSRSLQVLVVSVLLRCFSHKKFRKEFLGKCLSVLHNQLLVEQKQSYVDREKCRTRTPCEGLFYYKYAHEYTDQGKCTPKHSTTTEVSKETIPYVVSLDSRPVPYLCDCASSAYLDTVFVKLRHCLPHGNGFPGDICNLTNTPGTSATDR